MAVEDYSTTPALNTSISGIDISEGAAAAGFNNALRQIMADIAVWTAAYAVTYPIAVDKGGTGQDTVAEAFNALAAEGGDIGDDVTIHGLLARADHGVFPYFSSSSMNSGAMFVQAEGADPTSSPGDIVFEW